MLDAIHHAEAPVTPDRRVTRAVAAAEATTGDRQPGRDAPAPTSLRASRIADRKRCRDDAETLSELTGRVLALPEEVGLRIFNAMDDAKRQAIWTLHAFANVDETAGGSARAARIRPFVRNLPPAALRRLLTHSLLTKRVTAAALAPDFKAATFSFPTALKLLQHSPAMPNYAPAEGMIDACKIAIDGGRAEEAAAALIKELQTLPRRSEQRSPAYRSMIRKPHLACLPLREFLAPESRRFFQVVAHTLAANISPESRTALLREVCALGSQGRRSYISGDDAHNQTEIADCLAAHGRDFVSHERSAGIFTDIFKTLRRPDFWVASTQDAQSAAARITRAALDDIRDPDVRLHALAQMTENVFSGDPEDFSVDERLRLRHLSLSYATDVDASADARCALFHAMIESVHFDNGAALPPNFADTVIAHIRETFANPHVPLENRAALACTALTQFNARTAPTEFDVRTAADNFHALIDEALDVARAPDAPDPVRHALTQALGILWAEHATPFDTSQATCIKANLRRPAFPAAAIESLAAHFRLRAPADYNDAFFVLEAARRVQSESPQAGALIATKLADAIPWQLLEPALNPRSVQQLRDALLFHLETAPLAQNVQPVRKIIGALSQGQRMTPPVLRRLAGIVEKMASQETGALKTHERSYIAHAVIDQYACEHVAQMLRSTDVENQLIRSVAGMMDGIADSDWMKHSLTNSLYQLGLQARIGDPAVRSVAIDAALSFYERCAPKATGTALLHRYANSLAEAAEPNATMTPAQKKRVGAIYDKICKRLAERPTMTPIRITDPARFNAERRRYETIRQTAATIRAALPPLPAA